MLKLAYDGTPDVAYNAAAEAALAAAGAFSLAPHVDVDATGRAWITREAAGSYDVLRLTATGAADTTWGPGGRVAHPPLDAPQAGDVRRGLAIAGLADGSVLTATSFGRSGQGARWLIAKLTPTGALDVGFRGTGIVSVNQTPAGAIPSGHLVVASNGSICATRTQRSVTTDTTLCVTKLSAAGQADGAFGTTGVSCFDGVQKAYHRLITDAEGRLLAIGSAPRANSPRVQGYAVRFGNDGAPDPTFGTAGEVRVTFAPGTSSLPWDTAFGSAWLDPAGSLTLGGNLFAQGATTTAPKLAGYYALWRTDAKGVAAPGWAFFGFEGNVDKASFGIRQTEWSDNDGHDVVVVPTPDGYVLGLHGNTDSKTIQAVRWK